jgi:hypothetical protein
MRASYRMVEFKVSIVRRGLESREGRRIREGQVSRLLWVLVFADLREWLVRRN